MVKREVALPSEYKCWWEDMSISRHSLTKGWVSMGPGQRRPVSGFIRGLFMMEMGNQVLWVKLNLSYTAQEIANVWVFDI